MIQWESLLERDYIYLLEFDPNVKYYEAQSVEIKYLYQGKEYTYYPDFKVTTVDDFVEIVEVKPFKFLNKEENLRKFEAGRIYCEQKKWEYLVVTEENIRVGHIQENLRKLFYIDYDYIQQSFLQKILEVINNVETIQLGSLVEEFTDSIDKSVMYANIFYLIINHKLYTDLINTILNDYSILKLNR